MMKAAMVTMIRPGCQPKSRDRSYRKAVQPILATPSVEVCSVGVCGIRHDRLSLTVTVNVNNIYIDKTSRDFVKRDKMDRVEFNFLPVPPSR